MADAIYEIDKIVGRRITKLGKEEYLVHWKDYSSHTNTWEPIENLQPCLNTVLEFMSRSFPIPGINATHFVQLESESATNPSKSQVQLKKVTDIKTGKLRKLANKNKAMFEEIMKEKAKNAEVKKTRKTWSRKRKSADSLQSPVRLNGTFNGLTLRSPTMSPPSPKKRRRRNLNLPDVELIIEGQTRRRKAPERLSLTVSKHQRKTQTEIDVENESDEAVSFHFSRTTRMHGTLGDNVSLSKDNYAFWKITLSNEEKKNALTVKMCEEFVSALHEAAKEDHVNVVMVTGAGEFFCSGLDYSQLIDCHCPLKSQAKLLVEKYKHLVQMLINFPKPLVAAVNGPVTGFGTSLLGLCDVVYSVNKCSFQMNYAKWGHPPIGCSSFLLPHAIGTAGAVSMLMLNTDLSADEAWENGLVKELLDTSDFTEQVTKKVQAIARMPAKCLQDTKKLLRHDMMEDLERTIDEECKLFLKYLSDEQFVSSLASIWKPEVEVFL